MGSAGRTPILHVGGVQDAKTVAPPRLARAVALLLPELLVVLVKAATSGLVVLQVSGGLPTVAPKVSTTVAGMGTLPPFFFFKGVFARVFPPLFGVWCWGREGVCVKMGVGGSET